eukprot:7480017-Pyramimonas_sp.AAC.1
MRLGRILRAARRLVLEALRAGSLRQAVAPTRSWHRGGCSPAPILLALSRMRAPSLAHAWPWTCRGRGASYGPGT